MKKTIILLILLSVIIPIACSNSQKGSNTRYVTTSKIKEQWNILANDGYGEAEILLYENGIFSFVGWKNNAHGKWVFNKEMNSMTFVFIDSPFFTKCISNLANASFDYKKEWDVVSIDIKRSSITFKVKDARSTSSRSGKRINFFGYYLYHFEK